MQDNFWYRPILNINKKLKQLISGMTTNGLTTSGMKS